MVCAHVLFKDSAGAVNAREPSELQGVWCARALSTCPGSVVTLGAICCAASGVGSAPRGRESPVEEGSTRIIVDRSGSLRRGTPWCWVACEHCMHRKPVAFVPFIIRWGPDASSDLLRQAARCGSNVPLAEEPKEIHAMADKPGSCLCGAVAFEITGPLRSVIACHCHQCRKQTGT
jgi:hypothetical protein